MAVKKSRHRALRLNDEVARNLRHKKLPYTVGDLGQENVYLRVARTMKSVLVNVRVGGKRVIKTIGQVTEDQSYEFWREQARQEVDRLKRQRVPRAASTPETPTLEEVMQQYFDAHPELKERSIESYCSEIERGFRYQLTQPITALTRIEILRLDREHRADLKHKDPKGRPPKGTYSWSGSLRALRTIIRWWAATQNLPSPWPNRKALKIAVPKARELPHELNSVEGRQKLVDALRAMNSTSARACLFVTYTGLRRKEATLLAASNLTADGALQYESKTRSMTIPLSRQALALINVEGTGSLLGVSEWSLRKPLILIGSSCPG